MHRGWLASAAVGILACGVFVYLRGASPSTPSGQAIDPATLAAFGLDSLDLLARRPDELFEVPGRIVPMPHVEWGEYGAGGWDRWKPGHELPDGRHWIQANQPVAVLRLPASAARERVVELEVWCAARASAAAPEVRVRLNGEVLGSHPLSDEPTLLKIIAPGALWRLGENLLELETPEQAPGELTGSLRWDRLALASVSYGQERRVTYDVQAGEFALAPTTGLRYLAETTGSAQLALTGFGDAPGELSVRIGSMRARDGLSPDAPTEYRLEVERGVNRMFPIEAHAGAQVASIELDWQPSDGEASFHLEFARVLEAEPRPRPNVILVSIDTLAARHMSVYGYERATTPVLETFAEDAVVFERCVANAPWTLPSYLSALTGLFPLSHFVQLEQAPGVELENYDYWQVAESRWTLAEALRARGYQTAASLDTDWLSPRFHVDQGFDIYDLEPAGHPFSDPAMGIRFILERFGPWLDELRIPSAPSFVFIHALDAHGPYWPEAPFYATFEGDLPADPRMAPAGSAPQTFGAIPNWMAYSACPPTLRADVAQAWPVPAELSLEEIIARYDESILKTDASLGTLFAMLKERGLYEDSVIVVTGDHGESFAHDSYSHGVLWEDVLHIPLLIKLPGNELGGTRVDTSVQLVDLYPTLLELVGVGPPREYLHGRSLLEIRGGQVSPRPTFSQGGHIDQAMIESEGWKLVEAFPGRGGGVGSLITHPTVQSGESEWLSKHAPEVSEQGLYTESVDASIRGRAGFSEAFRELRERLRGPYYELYDLSRDPRELVNLADREPDRVRTLKALLHAEIERAVEAQADGRPVMPALQIDPESRKRLQDLGYAGTEGG